MGLKPRREYELKKKLVGILGLVSALAAFNPMGAHAANAGAFAFTGATTGLTPVLWVGGTGTYAFTGGCVVGASVSTTGPQVGVGCTVQASGSYTNVVCGTGFTGALALADSATITSGSNTIGIKYSIVFVATVGVVVGTESSGTGAAAGVVQINAVPNTGGIPSGTCTNSFNVEVVAAGGGTA